MERYFQVLQPRKTRNAKKNRETGPQKEEKKEGATEATKERGVGDENKVKSKMTRNDTPCCGETTSGTDA
jgi:hypothetical protein